MVSVLWTVTQGLALAFAAPFGATQIFADGFEECGTGRWSSATVTPLAEQFEDLTPVALAEALGACAPSLTAAEFVLANGSSPGAPALADMSDSQSAIVQAFGTGGLVPRAGGAMIALSSGTAADMDAEGWVAPEIGVAYAHPSPGPPVFMSAHGGSFPGLPPSCPDGANSTFDSVGLRLTFQVPAGAARLLFDWLWIYSDYPEYTCTEFTDYALAIVVTGSSPSLPADRNVLLDSTGWPLSSSTSDRHFCTGCPGGNAALAGTGYLITGVDGAATDWHTAAVPVVPGETLVLDLLAFDVADTAFDNVLLLDGLRWSAD